MPPLVTRTQRPPRAKHLARTPPMASDQMVPGTHQVEAPVPGPPSRTWDRDRDLPASFRTRPSCKGKSQVR
jgi:hypothetical protein